MSTVYDKISEQVIHVLINFAAAFNCISSNPATRLGIKEFGRAKCPPIILPNGATVSPVGMTTLKMRFVRDNKLAQDYILGADEQIQLKVRLDWEQSLFRINEEPVPMNRSINEAKLQLGSMASDAISTKFKEPEAKMVEYLSVVEDEDYSDPIADK